MSLTRNLKAQVTKKARDEGQSCYWTRCVTIHEGDDWLVDATVTVRKPYDVTLSRDDDFITAWCDCTMLCRQSTLAAVPLNTRKTSASSPIRARIRSSASRVYGSSPYDGT